MTIAVQDLRVQRHHASVLRDVSFEVEAGSFCVLLGPNGSGKTTLLRAVAGVVPYDGEISIDGVTLRSQPPTRRAQLLAYAQQEPVFPLDMTVEHFVMLARLPYQGHFQKPSDNDHEVVQRTLTQCGIHRMACRKLASLSGGEKRRATLAQALAQETSVVLLDEPTTALDIGQQQAMLELVDAIRLEHRKTFVVALHDLTLSQQFATDVVFLHNGTLVGVGAAESILQLKSLERYYETPLAQLSDRHTRAIVARRRRSM